jgi:hypothetical protein
LISLDVTYSKNNAGEPVTVTAVGVVKPDPVILIAQTLAKPRSIDDGDRPVIVTAAPNSPPGAA